MAPRNSGTEEKEDSRKQNKTVEILNESIEDYLEELELYNDWI
ncbi:6312_t:CDS:1, partial [Ambispora leptoticha]